MSINPAFTPSFETNHYEPRSFLGSWGAYQYVGELLDRKCVENFVVGAMSVFTSIVTLSPSVRESGYAASLVGISLAIAGGSAIFSYLDTMRMQEIVQNAEINFELQPVHRFNLTTAALGVATASLATGILTVAGCPEIPADFAAAGIATCTFFGSEYRRGIAAFSRGLSNHFYPSLYR